MFRHTLKRLFYLASQERTSEADRFRYADCEFSSIFQNVLDGILIVIMGDCLT